MVGESFITIRKKKHPLLFTMLQVHRYAELMQEHADDPLAAYTCLVLSAMEVAARRKGEDMPDIPYKELSELIDERFSDGSGDADRVMTDYQNSHIYKRNQAEAEKKMNSLTGTT